LCTVTFIPKSNGSFILTSNRDEAPGRATIAPSIYNIDGVDCLFPKDEVAGGTWLGVSDKKRLICLLNGGFEAHKREDRYRMSRGIVVKMLLVASDLISEVNAFNFTDIEPFTIVAVNYEKEVSLYEFVWDGMKAHFTQKPLVSTIWSSSLLYDQATKQKREQWFSSFIEINRLNDKDLLEFHKTAGVGDISIDLIMNRGFIKTKAITQVIFEDAELKMRYEDLQINKVATTIF